MQTLRLQLGEVLLLNQRLPQPPTPHQLWPKTAEEVLVQFVQTPTQSLAMHKLRENNTGWWLQNASWGYNMEQYSIFGAAAIHHAHCKKNPVYLPATSASIFILCLDMSEGSISEEV